MFLKSVKEKAWVQAMDSETGNSGITGTLPFSCQSAIKFACLTATKRCERMGGGGGGGEAIPFIAELESSDNGPDSILKKYFLFLIHW